MAASIGAALLVCTLSACPALPPEAESLELVFEGTDRERQRRIAEKLLGPDRWRRLDQARFQIELHDHHFTPALVDNSFWHDEVETILARSVGRMAQKGLQRRFRLYERRDAFRERLRDRRGAEESGSGRGLGLDLSPRVRLGDRPWIGAKLRLRGVGDGFWSRTSLRLGSELDGGDPSVKLAVRSAERRAFIAYHPDHARRGESVEVQFGFSF